MKQIIIYFLTWKFFIYCLLLFSIFVIPLQIDFLGGGLKNYLHNPYLWPFLNFDGEHYLSIALDGYKPLTYFYFPAFPLIVRLITKIFTNGSAYHTAQVGLWVSNLSFLIALIGIYKLIRIDFSEKIAYLTLILLLIFPTSYYFASFYNESLFLALTLWCFYFARDKKWHFAGVLGAFATLTRVVGLAIIPALLIEAYLQTKNHKTKSFTPLLWALSAGLGIIGYAIYVYMKTGDPLEFVHSVEIFGQQRSASLIALPQVFYRYIFKILPNINYNYIPVVLTTYLELFSAGLFTFLMVLSFIKLRLSYAVYSFSAFIIPTLSGSFSSLPRYVLVIFPLFLLMAIYISKMRKSIRLIILFIPTLFFAICTMLFYRGFWIS